MSLFLSGATLDQPDGKSLTDVRMNDGQIVDVGSLTPDPDDEVIDASGYLVLPAPAEPHAHLDKALTADRVVNATGDLMGAIHAWIAHRSTLTVDDIVERATEAVRLGVSNGITAFRTHVDLGVGIDLTGLEALQQVKANLAEVASIEIVGLIGCPLSGPAGADHRAIIRSAIEAGLDVVGGVPHLDEDSAACTRFLFELAAEHDLPLDLHTDENMRPDSNDLELLADLVLASGYGLMASNRPVADRVKVVASHCVSLGMQSEADQRRISAKVADAGISVLCLPQTNLFLQSRQVATAPARGLTALATLEAEGVNVAGGADNLQDPFCTVGRGDPLETASLLVMAGHLTPELAYDYVSIRARAAMGLPRVAVEAGSNADLLLIRAASIRQAVACAPADRVVIRSGKPVFRVNRSAFAAQDSVFQEGEFT